MIGAKSPFCFLLLFFFFVCDIGGAAEAAGMRVYVYEMPAEMNRGAAERDARCLGHMFAAEVRVHAALLSSRLRTRSPRRADWFFVPVYTTCDLTPAGGHPMVGDMPRMMAAAVRLVASRWPFWNRTDGADHFFVVPHDYAACFHFMEGEAIRQGIFPLLRHATLLQTFGQRGHACFSEERSIVIPPYVPPDRILTPHTLATAASAPRSTFAYFRGVFYDVNNDPEGGHYARGVRAAIWEHYKDNALFDLSAEHTPGYYEDMMRSIFCLCPLGWAPWSPRLVQAVVLGCIPVVIADGIVLPYAGGDAVPWDEIAVTVSESDVPRLGAILAAIDSESVKARQRLMRDPRVKRALLFPRIPRPGDAFHQAMDALARKLPHDRSIYKPDPSRSTLDWASVSALVTTAAASAASAASGQQSPPALT